VTDTEQLTSGQVDSRNARWKALREALAARWAGRRVGQDFLDRLADQDFKKGAVEKAQWCGRCGTDLGPDATVWLAGEPRPMTWNLRWYILPVCEACHSGHQRHPTTLQCRYCDRYMKGDGRWVRQRSTCSYRCTRLARQGARREPRPCDECGEVFPPTRADGRYCPPACRQKAYRARKAVIA
jgi:hypothetical protein